MNERTLEIFPVELLPATDHHRAAAETIYPCGTWLRCAKCGHVQAVTVAQVAEYFSGRAFTCHGEMMHLGDAQPSN